MSTSSSDSKLQDEAFSERRLGLLILDNKDGAALVGAIAHLNRALEIWRQLDWPTRAAEVQLDLARLHAKARNHGEAATQSAEAVHIFAGANDERAIDAAIIAGRANLEVNRAPEALRVLLRAAQIADDLNDHLRIAAVQLELGRALETGEVLSRFADWQRDRGDLVAAESVLERALAIYTRTGKQGLAAQALRRLGTIHAKRGAPDKAEERYLRSLELCRALEDQEGLSRTYYLLGATELRAGRVDDGLAHLHRSVDAAEKANQPGLIEPALAAIARVLRNRGEHDAALMVMHRWVEVLKAQGDRSDALHVLGTIAEVHLDKGAWDQAEAHLERLVRVTGTPADRDLHTRALRQLGTVEARRGAWTEARAHLTEALESLTPDVQPETRAALNAQIGHVCLKQADAIRRAGTDQDIGSGGHPDCLIAAVEHLQTAERQFRFAGDEQSLAKVLVDLGNANVLLGQNADARQAFEEAAVACEKQGDVRATSIIRRATRSL